MYAKFINETKIEFPPKNKDSIINYDKNEKRLIEDGYKPLITDTNVISGRLYEITYTQDETNIYEHINYLESEDEFNKRTEDLEKKRKINKLYAEIDNLDIKRIRAICEPAVKNEETGETWLDYYNNQVRIIRDRIQHLEGNMENDNTN